MSEAGRSGLYSDTLASLERCVALSGGKEKAEMASQFSSSQKHTPLDSPSVSNSLDQPTGTSKAEPSKIDKRAQSAHNAQDIEFIGYKDETQIAEIMALITKDLSEPYSIYTYRYFIHGWPELCILARDLLSGKIVGTIVCKLEDVIKQASRRKGYIAMLAVDSDYRNMGIGTKLVQTAIQRMRHIGCDEVVLETEVTNKDASKLYGKLGFIREKRLFRYYLNGGDAFRLKLYFAPPLSYHALPQQQFQSTSPSPQPSFV
ncbi:unnamed protein product, partial [Mesorhabditis belari]|uniref:N-acetyltransferase domain-containing protein n=1 Tax=Mesorhabditis belari TaxID=2138241 RepID=A0AAF3FE67_9BILA